MSTDPLKIDQRILDLENTVSQLEEFQVFAKESHDKTWHMLIDRIHYLDNKLRHTSNYTMMLEVKYNEIAAYVSLLEQRIDDLTEKLRSYGDRGDPNSKKTN